MSTSLTELKPGMVLTIAGKRAPIRFSVWLEQDDFVWSEHMLDLPGQWPTWLSVETEDGLTLTSWETRSDLIGEPGGRTMRLDGRRWRREEKGVANFMCEGPAHYPAAGTCEYHDYRDGDARLSFERFATLPWEVSLGRRLNPSDVGIEEAS